MLQQVRQLVAGFKKALTTRSSSPAGRQARLGIESLEDRSLMSVSSVSSLAVTVQPANTAVVQQNIRPPIIFAMANLRNVAFNMTSLDNGTTHQLLIQTQINNFFGSATITGKWDGQNGIGSPVSGRLAYDANGNIHITFTWGNGTHGFDGTISGMAGHYHIDGQVTVTGGGGPGHVVGDQAQPIASLLNDAFNMTSLDNGTTHQLLIRTQTNNPYGSATFTGTWDGAKGPGSPVTGTLTHDANGNIHITFTWGNGTHSFAGTISGFAGHYHIDGEVTVTGGSGPGHVVGDQAQPMASLLNDAFNMTSLDNGTAHQLLIQTQANTPYGTATFTGRWDGQNGSGGTAVSGTLTHDASGNIHITFTFGNHSFDGTISGTPGQYHIDGEVTVPGGGGPGHVVGDQAQAMANLQNVLFNMTSLDNGTTHQLLIQTQTSNPYGSATFTGKWDGDKGIGSPVTGTLTHDANGNIHITFTWGNGTHSFDGTITLMHVGFTILEYYHIDGQVTVTGGGGPGHVVGDSPLINLPVLKAS